MQVDAGTFPGAVISDVSVANGAQATLSVNVSLWQSNWWVAVQGKWIGYYPASLFSRGRTGVTLADRATRVLFGGEVFSSNPSPLTTTCQMGSGSAPAAGIGIACLLEQMRVQSDLEGSMKELSAAAPRQERPEMYSLTSLLNSGSPRGSYMLAGGSGAAP